MKEKINKIIWWIEQFFLNNMTLIIILIIFWVITSKLLFIISTEYTFTSIWAILAFWYWYKKYERDKEISFLNTLEIRKLNIDELTLKWNYHLILHKKWIIQKYLWTVYENHYINLLKEKISTIILYTDDDSKDIESDDNDLLWMILWEYNPNYIIDKLLSIDFENIEYFKTILKDKIKPYFEKEYINYDEEDTLMKLLYWEENIQKFKDRAINLVHYINKLITP